MCSCLIVCVCVECTCSFSQSQSTRSYRMPGLQCSSLQYELLGQGTASTSGHACEVDEFAKAVKHACPAVPNMQKPIMGGICLLTFGLHKAVGRQCRTVSVLVPLAWHTTFTSSDLLSEIAMQSYTSHGCNSAQSHASHRCKNLQSELVEHTSCSYVQVASSKTSCSRANGRGRHTGNIQGSGDCSYLFQQQLLGVL